MSTFKNILTFCFFATIIQLKVLAQQNPYNEVSIATPTAASLGKYADVPVNNHTGIPSISIPIYQIKQGAVSLPITLSYHASGLKVLETASWVGAGWSLNAGGVITRTVRGAPDEKHTSSVYNQAYGHFSDYGYSKYAYYGSDGQNAGLEGDEFNTGKRDGEPDLFSFNVGGLSGKFYFRDDRTAVFEPQQDIKVQYEYTGTGSIQNFVLTGTDGTRYHFGIQNSTTYAVPIEQTNPVNGKDGYIEGKVISSWYLNKVESADGLNSILLNYVTEQYSFYSLSMFPIAYDARTDQIVENDYEYSLIKNVVKGVRLNNISFSDGTITFYPGDVRQDLTNFSTALTPEVINTNAYALGRIEINNNSGFCKKFVFTYDYFLSSAPLNGYFSGYGINSDKKRLKLNSVQEFSCDETVSAPAHTFEYFTEAVPRRLSFGQDHWGFYTGVTNNTTLIPTYTENDFTVYPGANRNPVWPAMRAGTLKKIIYPTGGSTLFDFEANYTWAESKTYNEASRASMFVGWGYSSPSKETTITLNANPHRVVLSNSSTNNQTAYLTVYNSANAVVLSITALAGESKEVTQNFTSGAYRFVLVKEYTISQGAEANVYEKVPSTYARNEMVGGLRIKTITHSNGLASPDRVISYSYLATNGRSSGVLYNRPTYVQVVRSDEIAETKASGPFSTDPPNNCNPNGCISCDGSTQLAYQMSPNGIRPLGSSQGNHIGYNEVKVTEPGNGYSIYRYYGSDKWDAELEDIAIRNVDTKPPCSLSIPSSPEAPLAFEPLRGELKYEGHYSEAAVLLKEADYYRYVGEDVVKTPGRIAMAFVWKFNTYYEIKAFRKTEETVIQRLFSTGGTITETSSTFFESSYHFQPTRKLAISSAGQNIETKYKYSADFRTSSCDGISNCYQTYADAVSQASATYQQQKQLCETQQCFFNNYQSYRSNLTLARRNYIDCRNNYMNPDLAGSYAKCRLDAKAAASTELKPIFQLTGQNNFSPIEISEWKNGKLTGASFNRYDYVTNPANIVYLNKTLSLNLTQPSTAFSAATVSSNTITKDSRYTDEVFFKFDYGNLVEMTKKDGIVNTFIWGYNRLHPVAKVEGASYTSVNAILSQTTLQDPASDQALRDELNKIRQNFPSALVTTYTYKKLVGPSSISEANNKPMYYEYDNLGRLNVIRDFNQNIQKIFNYKFQSIQ